MVAGLWNWLMQSQLTRFMVLNKKSYMMHDSYYEEKVSKERITYTPSQDNDRKSIKSASIISLLD